MFKRFSIHFALILLFAFAQMGAVTHQISHIEDYNKHSQQDPHEQSKGKQNTSSEQCEQCLSFAKIAGGLPTQSFILPVFPVNFIGNAQPFTQALPQPHTAYAARAPPSLS